MQLIGDFLVLPFRALQTYAFNLKEEKKVRQLFYKNPLFKKVDTALKQAYRKLNPYTVCRQFMQSQKRRDVHVYGETPLSAIYQALKDCKVGPHDHFVDLGCGRGRTCLFVSSYFGCKVSGVEIVPVFCSKAEAIGKLLPSPPHFFKQDMLTFNLDEATFIYFYGLCLTEEEFAEQITRLESTKKEAKVITVSFPLSDYSAFFSTLLSYQTHFPWGKTTVFVNSRKNAKL